MTNPTAVRIDAMLVRMNVALKTRFQPELTKELVFNRVRMLRSEGYADDVAFAISLKEHNLGWIAQ